MYITHVQEFGPFLKVFGQSNKGEAIKVERAIRYLKQELTQMHPPNITEIATGMICLGLYTDKNFYRSRITVVGVNGLIGLNFIDYGNDEVVDISMLRLIEKDDAHRSIIIDTLPLAEDYILARVFSQWSPKVLGYIRKEICNEEVDVSLEEQVNGFEFIGLNIGGDDYSLKIVTKRWCDYMALDSQKEAFQRQMVAKQSQSRPQQQQPGGGQSQRFRAPEYLPPRTQMEVASTMFNPNQVIQLSPRSQALQFLKRPVLQHLNFNQASSGGGQPVQIRPHRDDLHNKIQRLPPPQAYLSTQPPPATTRVVQAPRRTESSGPAIFKSNILEIGETYIVRVSYVVDGPDLFYVQLADKELELTSMMTVISKTRLPNLSQVPTIGMACIARYSKNKQLYRAVVTNISAVGCQLLFVDYGHSETIAYTDIFEISDEFLGPEIYAMRFALSGYQDLHPLTDHIRSRFNELVDQKRLKMKVVIAEGSVSIQYGSLYDGKLRIYDELKHSAKNPPKFKPAMELNNNYHELVFIRYVHAPDQFFVQPVNNVEACNQMMDQLMLHCRKAKPLAVFTPGTACASKFEDNEWYRAQIVGKEVKNKISVKYVDFGNEGYVEKEHLREINSQLATLPCQAIECCLKGFENLKVQDNARVQLEMLSEDKGDRKPLRIELVSKLKNGIAIVNLYDESFSPPLDISKRMLKMSVAPRQFSELLNQQPSKDGHQQSHSNTTVSSIQNNATVMWPIQNETSNWDESSSIKITPQKYQSSPIEPNSQKSTTSRDSWGLPRKPPGGSLPWRNQENNTTQEEPWNSQPPLAKSTATKNDAWTSDRRNENSPPFNSSKYENFGMERRNDRFIRGGGDGAMMQHPARPEFRDANERSFTSNKNQRQLYTNEYKREKFSNMKKLIPRFNKQLNAKNSKGKERNMREKWEGKQIEISDSSGKFSQSTKTSSQKNSSWDEPPQTVVSAAKEPTPPVDTVEYVPYATQFTSANIIFGRTEEVQMAWWISPFDFYVYYKNMHDNLLKMTKEIQRFYKSLPPTKKEPSIGNSVIARYAKDNVFYRAKILDYNKKLNKYRVQFVDYGNLSIVQLDSIWPIEKRFMDLPIVAIRCSLGDIVYDRDHSTILEKIDTYLKSPKSITCVFKKTENEMNLIELTVDGQNLRNRMIEDGLILSLPSHIDLDRLAGQTILAKFVSIKDINNFRIVIEGCDTKLPCASYTTREVGKSDEFIRLYDNQEAALYVDQVSRDKMLMVTPLIPLLDEDTPPIIFDCPILTSKFPAIIVHVESDNVVVVQRKDVSQSLTALLDGMFSYYEEKANNLPAPQLKTSSICAVKSFDQNWYRGYIESVKNGEEVVIRYIDYGNTETVPKKDLRVLEKRFYTPSAFAFKMYLPIRSKKLNEAKQEMIEITPGIDVEVEIIGYKHECWIGDFQYQSNSIVDVLCNKKLAARVSVNELDAQLKNDHDNRVKYIETDVEAAMAEPSVKKPEKRVEPSHEAIVGHVDNPNQLYLILSSDMPSLDKLMDNIQLVASQLPNLTDIKAGVTCVSKYVDDLWYRAKVLDFGDGVVTIQYIDYGNTDVITDLSTNVLKISPDVFMKYPPYAIPCSLPIYPLNSRDWCDKSTKILYDLIGKSVGFDYISKVGAKTYINLFYEDQCMEMLLVEEKYAGEWDVINNGSKCYISNITSLDDFTIQIEGDKNNLELMADYLADSANFDPLDVFTEGTMCVAQFPDDDDWYRARIISHNADGAQVLFVDYGNESHVTNLRKLIPEIAEIPFLSKNCSLHMPVEISCWSDEAEERFKKLINDFETIFGVEMYEPGKRISVCLYIDDKDIIDELIPLCKKRPQMMDSMSESVVEEMLFPTISKGLPVQPKTRKIAVAHVESVNEVYVHDDIDLFKLNDIRQYLEHNGDNLTELKSKEVGKLCIARFKTDDVLYRATIVDTGADACKVRFIDYGNVSDSSALYEIPDIIGTEKIPSVAKCIGLFGQYEPEAMDKFCDLVENYNCEFQCEVVDSSASPNLVRLFSDGTNVNEKLLEMVKNDLSVETESPDSSEILNHAVNENGIDGKSDDLAAVIKNIDKKGETKEPTTDDLIAMIERVVQVTITDEINKNLESGDHLILKISDGFTTSIQTAESSVADCVNQVFDTEDFVRQSIELDGKNQRAMVSDAIGNCVDQVFTTEDMVSKALEENLSNMCPKK